MISKVVSSVTAALDGVRDGATVMIGGFGGAGQPAELIDALIAQGARDLTIVNNNAGNGELGLAALIKARRVRKVICSFPRQTNSHHFDALYRAGKIDLLKTYIDRVHDMGTLAGISTHNPAILDALREKDFSNDFYMAGLHYLTRRPEDWMRDIGTTPLDEGWIASDPPKMVEAVRKVSKPCLLYKVLGAGRKCGSAEEKRKAIEWAYKNIKPADATIIGLYPRFSDQVTETTTMVREILA